MKKIHGEFLFSYQSKQINIHLRYANGVTRVGLGHIHKRVKKVPIPPLKNNSKSSHTSKPKPPSSTKPFQPSKKK